MKDFVLRMGCLATLMVAVACSGGSGGGEGGVLDAPMANVAGMWEVNTTNAGQAVFTGCTGDLVELNGLTAAFVFSLAPACSGAGYPIVDQNQNALTVRSQGYTCSNGVSGVFGGGGTVTGNSLDVQLDSANSVGVVGIDHYKGAVSGDSISLNESSFEVRGRLVGTCQLQPALNVSGRIVRDKAISMGGDSLAQGVLEYLRDRP